MPKFSKKFVGPDGPENAIMLFVGEAPGEQEDIQGKPFVGDAGQTLRTGLKAAGVDVAKEVRFFNSIPYRPLQDNGRGGYKNRTPDHDEVDEYSVFLKKDIEDYPPKLIVCCGWAAIYALTGFTGTVGEAMKSFFKYEGIPVQVVWHPSFLLRNGGQKAPQYKYWIESLRNCAALARAKSKVKTGEKSKFVYDVFHWKDVDKFLAKFEEAKLPGYDIEGSSLEPLEVDFHLAGFSLSTPSYSAYLTFRCFERYSDYPDKKTIEKLTKFFQKKEKQGGFVVFNLCYEVPATNNIFGVEMMRLMDMMQYGRVLNMTGTLKEISAAHLGETMWKTELEDWTDALTAVLKVLKPTNTKKGPRPKKEMAVVHDEGLAQLYVNLDEANEAGNLNTRTGKLYENLKYLITVAKDCGIKTSVFWPNLQAIIIDNQEHDRDEAIYTQIPEKIISLYCCKDSWNTRRLYDYVMPQLKEQKLEKCANYFNEHAYLAYELDMNGIPWDDVEASRINDEYGEKQRQVLRELILLENVSKYLELTKQDILKIQATTDLDELKEFFNPNSTDAKAKARVQDLLITRPMKTALLLNKVKGLFLSNESETEEDLPTLVSVMKEIEDTGREKEDPVEKRKLRTAALNAFRNSIPKMLSKGIFNQEEVHWVNEYGNFQLEGLGKEELEEVYNAAKLFMGINIDKRESLTPETEFLLLYKLFKKIDKAIGTYIWGKPGRDSVRVVSNENAQSENRILYRKSPYIDTIDESESYVLCTTYNPNVAATKRWSATAHTIPANSDLRDIHHSRFDDGFIVHWDGSQIEVITIACLAGEQSMIDAYTRGSDLHRFVASKVFNVPEKEVTKQQRKHSKLVSFGILYGSSIRSVADGFMNGDMAGATRLFNAFFALFPKVKKWIEAKHREVMEHNFVTTAWGDKILIPFDREQEWAVAEAMRFAQNYPVQNLASQLAGLSIARTSRWIRENGYLARPICFTHDASDTDVPGKELFPLCNMIPKLVEDLNKEEFGVPLRIELEIGTRGNKLVKLAGHQGKHPVSEKKGKYFLDAEIEGTADAIQLLQRSMKPLCSEIKIDIKEEDESLVSIEELFVTKRAYTSEVGQTVKKQIGTIHAVSR